MASICTYYVPKCGSTSVCDQNCGLQSADRHTDTRHTDRQISKNWGTYDLVNWYLLLEDCDDHWRSNKPNYKHLHFSNCFSECLNKASGVNNWRGENKNTPKYQKFILIKIEKHEYSRFEGVNVQKLACGVVVVFVELYNR